MSIVITRTDVGAKKEQDALLDGATLPKITKLVFYDSTAITWQDDIRAIKTLTGEVHTIGSEDLLFNRLESPVTIISAAIAPETEFHITGLALVLEDGTIWGYAPYRPEKGGLAKTSDFGITVKVAVTHSDEGSISIRYSPFDTDIIIEQIKAEIDGATDLTAYLKKSMASTPTVNVSIGGLNFS